MVIIIMNPCILYIGLLSYKRFNIVVQRRRYKFQEYGCNFCRGAGKWQDNRGSVLYRRVKKKYPS